MYKKHFRPEKPECNSKFFKKKKKYNYKPTKNSQTTCYRCGNKPHSKEQCPAKNAKCHKCSNVGHFAKLCRTTKSIGEIEAQDSNVEGFLEHIILENKSSDWLININVENHTTVEFKIDTGADVTVIPPGTTNKCS